MQTMEERFNEQLAEKDQQIEELTELNTELFSTLDMILSELIPALTE